MKVGTLDYMVLSVLCAEPLTAREVIERMDKRYGSAAMRHNGNTVSVTLKELREMGRAREVGKVGARKLTVLTPRGEELLDRLFDEGVVRCEGL